MMPEQMQLTVDFTWLRAALTMLASTTVIAVACIGGCRHVRRAMLDVLAELHSNTLATENNGKKLDKIENQLKVGDARFANHEGRLIAAETQLVTIGRRTG